MNYEWKDTVLADLFPYAPTTTLGDPSFKRPVSGAPGWLSGWASAFGSGHGPGVLGLSPTLGSLLGGRSASPFSTPPACVPSLTVSLSVK